jgi:putative ABC transport system permease protein
MTDADLSSLRIDRSKKASDRPSSGAWKWVISFTGGAIGIAMASFLRYLEISTTNFDTFAEIAFSFKMSGTIALQALTFTIAMGLIGGFLPSVRASRLRVVQALRAR